MSTRLEYLVVAPDCMTDEEIKDFCKEADVTLEKTYKVLTFLFCISFEASRLLEVMTFFNSYACKLEPNSERMLA